MKMATLIARILLGLIFFVVGANHVMPFLPMPAMPASDGTTYLTLLMSHHVFTFIGLLMVVSGLLLLVGRFVPLALVILGPIIVNILMYHLMIEHGGVAVGLLTAVLELFLISVYRKSFYSLFHPAPEVF
jgi:putative oxidoreductase